MYPSLALVRDILAVERTDDYLAVDVDLQECAGLVLVAVDVDMSVPGRAPEPTFMPDETPESYRERHESERLRWQSYVTEQIAAKLRREGLDLESIRKDPANEDPLDALALGTSPVAVWQP